MVPVNTLESNLIVLSSDDDCEVVADLVDELFHVLKMAGLDSNLSLESQTEKEHAIYIWINQIFFDLQTFLDLEEE